MCIINYNITYTNTKNFQSRNVCVWHCYTHFPEEKSLKKLVIFFEPIKARKIRKSL